MAFTVTSQTGRLVKAIGSFTELACGMATMVSGKATVTVPALTRVDGVVGMVQGATGVGEDVLITASATNTFDIETVNEAGDTAGTSVVMWLAWGIPKA